MNQLSTTTLKKLNGLMAAGLAEHAEFVKAFHKAKAHAFRAGWFFLKAQIEITEGDWTDYLASYSDKVSATTVYRYMAFAHEATKWAEAVYPNLTGDALTKAALELAMQSPKGYIALCRQLELMRKFGEYDAVKYAQKRIVGDSNQVEFKFVSSITTLDMLTKIGDADFNLVFPDDRKPAECLTELESKLETALEKVRAMKNAGQVVEIEGVEPINPES